ncbi:hypothetical protein DY000_02022022 [Brassica cretica]|uniref:Uncharacterized protein n=1 Tax=Brassica cretica TaxID=69181 RepID=A0ABQ7E379_BRACR|nr:hypothetical protein DY000_02022022 [Brassica cretica]
MNLCQFQLSLLILEDRSKDYHQERRIGLILNATVHGDSNLMESWGFHIIWRYGDLKEIPIWNLNGPRLANEKLLPYWDLLEERIKDFGNLFVMVISLFLSPTTKGSTEEGDVGPSDKPDQGGKALSYKGAVESHHAENTSGGDSRRQNQQGAGKKDVKGKGIAYEGGRQGGVAKSGQGRRYRYHGRPTARYVRQAGYLPPQELNDSYVMATSGINGLRNQEVGGHLDTQQKLMLEAFKSGEKREASESMACKALLFENEGHEEGLVVTSGGDSVQTVQRKEEVMENPGFSTEVATAEAEGMEENNFVKCSSAESEVMQVMEMGNKEEAVSSEMVAGLDDEDGHLEYEMMEDGVDDAISEREASGDLNSMDVEEAFPIAESEDLVGEQEHQVPKKKNGKITAAVMGGNRKKRLV